MPTGTSSSVLAVIVGPPVPCRDYDRRYHLRQGTVMQAYRKLTIWECLKAIDTRRSCSRRALRANIAETLLVHSITEQGGKEIQHEEYEDILSGPVGRAQRSEERRVGKECRSRWSPY